MCNFDVTKPVQTRDGRKARIVCTNFKNGKYPIIALITLEDRGEEEIYRYTASGNYYHEDVNNGNDLINIPEEKVFYFAIGVMNHNPHISYPFTHQIQGVKDQVKVTY